MENIPNEIEVPETKPLPIPQSNRLRILYGITVTILPIFCFISINILKPEWQSGKFSDYVALFLSPKAAWMFFPLIAYSSISLLILLVSPKRYAESSLVRFGIYTGVFIALQFTILTFIVLLYEFYLALVAWAAPFVVIPIYRRLVGKWGARKINLIIAGIFFLWILFLIIPRHGNSYWGMNNILIPVYFLLAWLLISAPLWSLLIMGQTSYHLLKVYETKLTFTRGIGLVAWSLAFIEAWRFGIQKTLELYAALPTRPPDCYIATAAAHGHARIVGSREITLSSGQSMRVNAQLQRLKCAELVLQKTLPRAHKILRKIYDVVGKKLACRIKNPFLADTAYLFLKPFEWMTMIALQLLAPQAINISNKLYIY